MSATEVLRRAAFYPVDLMRGGLTQGHMRDLRLAFADPRAGRQVAEQRLRGLLAHATATTDHYRQFNGADSLDAFPVLPKETIRRDYEAFFSSGFRRASLVPMKTSGSYGTPFTFYLTKSKKARQLAELVFFGAWAGYELGQRHALISANKARSPFKLLLQNEVLMNPTQMTTEWLDQQRLKLRAGRIHSIIGYPSVIGALAEYCREQGDTPKDFSLAGIVATSEPLQETVRQTAEHVFGCRVLSRYSTQELGVLAHERPEDNKHVLNIGTFVFEFLAVDSDHPVGPGALGRVVITDLFSQAMPLIRYETGDLALLPKCPSDETQMPIIDQVEGRQVETIWNTAGVRISPFAIEGSLRDFSGILQFQFIQNDARDYTLRLAVLPSWDREEAAHDTLVKLLGQDADLSMEYVDSIPPQPSGKRPYILNRRGK